MTTPTPDQVRAALAVLRAIPTGDGEWTGTLSTGHQVVIHRPTPPAAVVPARPMWRPVIGTPEFVDDALATLDGAGRLVRSTPPTLVGPGLVRVNALVLNLPAPPAMPARPAVRPVATRTASRPTWVRVVRAVAVTAVVAGGLVAAWWALSWLVDHLLPILGGLVGAVVVSALVKCVASARGGACVTIHREGCH
jgi:hypothetical protein